MLTSEDVKAFAKEHGADLVGIAPIERFKDAPADMHPSTLFPETRSVVVFAMRIPRGCFRGIEEGTDWTSYAFFGYGGLAGFLSELTSDISRFIESHGWEAMPVMAKAALSEWGPSRPAVAPGKFPPDVVPSFRIAAAAAGLGEIGYSKVFLTPEFGPRQRLGMVLTDAPLEPDPIFEGSICDRCMACVRGCPASAISPGETVSIEIEGRRFEWGQIDTGKCKLTHFGINRKVSPFIVKDIPGFNLDVGRQEISWKKAHDLGWSLVPMVGYFTLIARNYGQYWPICGARGCIRACFVHLEESGAIKGFRNPFRGRTPWLLE